MWSSISVSYMFEMMLDTKYILRPVLVRSLTSAGKKYHLNDAS